MDIGTVAALVTVAAALSGSLTGLLGHWFARRAASGRVATSEAAVLWQQSQDLRSTLLAEKTKAEEQRDRFIDAYTAQVIPVLTEINETVAAMAATVTEVSRLVREVRASQEGGTRAISGPPP